MWLYIDNQKVQAANTAQMLYPLAELVSLASRLWGLRAGDILLSGSAPSEAAVHAGSQIEAGGGGIGTARFILA
jgi:fumarylpyruvate hydrolase